MALMTIESHENVPLWVDVEHQVIRIPGTRLKLQTVMAKHYRGATPAEIVRSFDTLTLDTVERILEWYPTRRHEVDAYVEWTDKRGEANRLESEAWMAEFRQHQRNDSLGRAKAS